MIMASEHERKPKKHGRPQEPDQLFRNHHGDLCQIFDSVNVEPLATDLYNRGIIDLNTKNVVVRNLGYRGADILLKNVIAKLKQSPECLELVFEEMEKQEILMNVVKKMKHDMNQLADTAGVRSRSHEEKTTDTHSNDNENGLSQPQERVDPTTSSMHVVNPHLDTHSKKSACKEGHSGMMSSGTMKLSPLQCPTVAEFAQLSSQEERWFDLGIYLDATTVELKEIETNYMKQGIARCYIELYHCLDKKNSKRLSWLGIVESLKNMNNIKLADHIRFHYITHLKSTHTPSASSLEETLLPDDGSSADGLLLNDVENDVAARFALLHEEFRIIAWQFELAFKNSNAPVDNVQSLLSKLVPIQKNLASLESIFERLEQHYSFLNFRIIIVIVKVFLTGHTDLLQNLENLEKNIDEFKSSTKMDELAGRIRDKCRMATDGSQLTKLKVRQFWGTFTIKEFEIVMNKILKTLYNMKSRISVDKGCICISWTIPADTIIDDKLVPKHSVEFLDIIGVISLHIGKDVFYKSEGELGCETIEAAMLQAIKAKNTQAIELLLSVGCSPEVAIYNGDKVVTTIVNIRESSDLGGSIVEHVCVFGHNEHIEAIANPTSSSLSESVKCELCTINDTKVKGLLQEIVASQENYKNERRICCEEFDTERDTLEQKIEELHQKNDALQCRSEQIGQKNETLQQEKKELCLENDVLKQTNEQLDQEIETLQQKNQELSQESDILHQIKKEANIENEELQLTIKKKNSELKESAEKLKAQEAVLKQLQEQLNLKADMSDVPSLKQSLTLLPPASTYKQPMTSIVQSHIPTPPLRNVSLAADSHTSAMYQKTQSGPKTMQKGDIDDDIDPDDPDDDDIDPDDIDPDDPDDIDDDEDYEKIAYEEALKNGSFDVAYGRIMLLGPGGVGKTSLRRGLMGQKFLLKGNSTIVADLHLVRPVNCEWIKGSGIWKKVSDEDEIEELAQLLALTSKQSQFRNEKEIGEDKDNIFVSSTRNVQQEQIQRIAEQAKTFATTKLLEKAYERVKKISYTDISIEPLLHLWDSGGQPVFMEVLPAFLTSRTMFLIVFDASKNLKDKIPSVHYKHGVRINLDMCNISTLELMEKWMTIIHAYLGLVKVDQQGVPEKYPQIAIVGTRGDLLQPNKSEAVLQELSDFLEKKTYTRIIHCPPMIIDNTTSGTEKQDKNYHILRERVHTFVEDTLKIETPVAWVLFRKVIQMVAKETSRNTITFSEVSDIAQHVCNITPTDLPYVLKFYHELGVFLYYPHLHGFRNTIILSPQWFVDVLGKILAPRGFGKFESFHLKKEWSHLHNTGILVQSLYTEVWRDLEEIKPDEMMDLLVSFHLAAPVDSIKDGYYDFTLKKFFVPSVLNYFPSALSKSVCFSENSKFKNVAPLSILFTGVSYILPGFFVRLVAVIAEHKLFSLHLDEGVYHDLVKFHFGMPVPVCAVSFHDITTAIEIQVESVSTKMKEHCKELMMVINTSCDKVEETLRSRGYAGLDKGVHEFQIKREIKVICQYRGCKSKEKPYHSFGIDEHTPDGEVCCGKELRKLEESEVYWMPKILPSMLSETDAKSSSRVFAVHDLLLLPDLPQISLLSLETDNKPSLTAVQQASMLPEASADAKTTNLSTVDDLHGFLADLPPPSSLEIPPIDKEQISFQQDTSSALTSSLRQSTPQHTNVNIDVSLFGNADVCSVDRLLGESARPRPKKSSATNQSLIADSTHVLEAKDPLNKRPTIYSAFQCLKSRASYWNSFGRKLGVSLDYRRGLVHGSDEDKLELVIEKWITEENREVSWRTLRNMLMDLKMKDTIRELDVIIKNC